MLRSAVIHLKQDGRRSIFQVSFPGFVFVLLLVTGVSLASRERFYDTQPLSSAQIYSFRGPSVMELNVIELMLPHSRIPVVDE